MKQLYCLLLITNIGTLFSMVNDADYVDRILAKKMSVPYRVFSNQKEPLYSVVISPDGKYVATQNCDKAKVWDIAEGKCVYTFPSKMIFAMAFSHDSNYLALGGQGKSVTVWNLVEGRLEYTCAGHVRPISALAFTKDYLIGSSFEERVRFWDIVTGQEQHEKEMVFGMGKEDTSSISVRSSHNGSLCACLYKNVVYLADSSGKLLYGKSRQFGTLKELSFSCNGAYFATISESDVIVFETETGTECDNCDIDGKTEVICFVNFDAKHKSLLVASGNGTVDLTNVDFDTENAKSKVVATLQIGSETARWKKRFSDDGTLLAAVSDRGEVKIWKIEELIQAQKMLDALPVVLLTALRKSELKKMTLEQIRDVLMPFSEPSFSESSL